MVLVCFVGGASADVKIPPGGWPVSNAEIPSGDRPAAREEIPAGGRAATGAAIPVGGWAPVLDVEIPSGAWVEDVGEGMGLSVGADAAAPKAEVGVDEDVESTVPEAARADSTVDAGVGLTVEEPSLSIEGASLTVEDAALTAGSAPNSVEGKPGIGVAVEEPSLSIEGASLTVEGASLTV